MNSGQWFNQNRNNTAYKVPPLAQHRRTRAPKNQSTEATPLHQQFNKAQEKIQLEAGVVVYKFHFTILHNQVGFYCRSTSRVIVSFKVLFLLNGPFINRPRSYVNILRPEAFFCKTKYFGDGSRHNSSMYMRRPLSIPLFFKSVSRSHSGRCV